MAVLLLQQMCGMSLVSAGGHQWGEASWVLNAPSWKPKPLGVYSVVQVAIRVQGTGNPSQWRKHPLTEPPLFPWGGGWVLLYIMTL